MSIEDYSIMRRSNKGDIKTMNIYTVASVLTFEEIEKLIQGKQVRRGYYLYYNKKFTDLESIEVSEDIEIEESDECTPFEDLEEMEDIDTEESDECTPFEDLEEIEDTKLMEEN